MEEWKPLTAAQRDRLPPEPDRGWWSRLANKLTGAGAMTQAGIITHRHQRRPDHLPGVRQHGKKGAGGVGNGP